MKENEIDYVLIDARRFLKHGSATGSDHGMLRVRIHTLPAVAMHVESAERNPR